MLKPWHMIIFRRLYEYHLTQTLQYENNETIQTPEPRPQFYTGVIILAAGFMRLYPAPQASLFYGK